MAERAETVLFGGRGGGVSARIPVMI